MALNDGQEIVEVVRNATGQLSNGFHFLRLAELLFQLLTLGDIGVDDQLGLRMAGIVAQEGPTTFRDHRFSVFRPLV